MTGPEHSSYNVEFEFVDMFYSKFQLESTFFICSTFCDRNWLLCCDLSCKEVTCRSRFKRIWKQALPIQYMYLITHSHIYMHQILQIQIPGSRSFLCTSINTWYDVLQYYEHGNVYLNHPFYPIIPGSEEFDSRVK